MWERNSWYLVIIFLSIFLIDLALAKNISLEFPEQVSTNEEFEVKILLKEYPEDTYSVKFDILTSGGRIALIYNPSSGKYQSTYYYVPNVLEPKQDGVLVKLKIIKEYNGEANISVKIRNSKGQIDELDNYKISVIGNQTNKTENDKKEDEKKIVVINKKIGEELADNITDNKDEIKNINENEKNDWKNIGNIIENNKFEELNEAINKSLNGNIIYLNKKSKDIKNQKDSEVLFKSNNQKIREFAIISFVFFCIILIILITIESRNKYFET